MPLRNNIFTNRNYKIRVLHILNHLACLYAAYYFSWTGLAVAIALYYFFFGWGIDIGMHRLFSHRAFKTFRFYEYLLLVFASLATVGSSIAWVGMHRRHHRSSDGPEDPHSRREEFASELPSWQKMLSVYFGIWPNYYASPKQTHGVRRLKPHQYAHYYYFLIIALYVGALSLISLDAVVWGYCVPATLCFHGASLIVTLGHSSEIVSKRTRDYSVDSVLLHWLTWGEGLHHSHHKYPNKYHFENQPWYLTYLPGLTIKYLMRAS